MFNDIKIQLANSQKHLRLNLDFKLNFNEHRDNKINKWNKIIGTIKRLSLILSRKCLLRVYKFFARPNIIYEKAINKSFKKKKKEKRKNGNGSVLVITGIIRRTSHDRLYHELPLESLADRRWSRSLLFFHKIMQGLLPSYLQTYHNAVSEEAYLTRSPSHNKLKPIPARTKVFENSFFRYCITEWSKLNDKIRNIKNKPINLN